MKTYDEKFHDHIDMTDGTCVLNEQVYKQIQADVLQNMYDLCKEGVSTFRKMGQDRCATGCDCCADNIKAIAAQHGINLSYGK